MEATLVTGRGETLRRAAAARVSGDPGRAAYAAEVPRTNLAAGDYVLALEARAGQRAASRQVPITVEVR